MRPRYALHWRISLSSFVQDTSRPPKGSLVLTGADIAPFQHPQFSHCFTITRTLSKKDFTLYADNVKDYSDWMTVLRAVAAGLSIESTARPISMAIATPAAGAAAAASADHQATSPACPASPTGSTPQQHASPLQSQSLGSSAVTTTSSPTATPASIGTVSAASQPQPHPASRRRCSGVGRTTPPAAAEPATQADTLLRPPRPHTTTTAAPDHTTGWPCWR